MCGTVPALQPRQHLKCPVAIALALTRLRQVVGTDLSEVILPIDAGVSLIQKFYHFFKLKYFSSVSI